MWPEKNCTNVYKSCPKLISLENLKILTSLQKLPKNVGDLGKLIVAKGFEKLPKVQSLVTLVPWNISKMLTLKYGSQMHLSFIGVINLVIRKNASGKCCSKFKPCLGPGYFLLQLSDCMMEACMLLAVVRVHEHWWLQLNPLGEWG